MKVVSNNVQMFVHPYGRVFRGSVCLFQGNVDDGDVCPTPDAPRTQTKAPRLDMYRPAPHVIVDTGRPIKKKPPQDQQELSDKSIHQDRSQHFKPSLSKDYPLVPSQTKSQTTVQRDQGPLLSQAQFRPSRPKADEQVPSDDVLKTSVLRDRNPVAAQTQFNVSEPPDPELRSQAVQVPAKPARPQNAQSKAFRLENSHVLSPQTKVRPQYHGKRQTEAKMLKTGPSETAVAHDSDKKKKKKKTDMERTQHHHHVRDNKGNLKAMIDENKANQPTSTDEATAVANDPDYAVKYRLGLVPRRSNEPKRRSEYQRQFQWRAFERNSPLMSAAQVHSAVVFIRMLIYFL